MPFELTDELTDRIESLIDTQDDSGLMACLEDLHHADTAEILDALNLDRATYIIKLLDSEKTAAVLMELAEDDRQKILNNLSEEEIASELEEMDTDDAADIMAELSEKRKGAVISDIKDQKHAEDIQELLRYDENSAGGLMAKELVRVRDTWSVGGCVREMRRQAKNVTRVHSIYVVDKKGKLIGRLSLKDLLTVDAKAKIADIYIPRVDFVDVNTPGEEVARIMQKYDLEAIPVVDYAGRLVGRVTIDDIVDFMKEEAEKDYQLAAGISQDVAADDSFFKHTRARFPWLALALLGGFIAVQVSGSFEDAMEQFGTLFFFTPLIAAMAGNVGVQSSALIVQGLANNTLGGTLFKRLYKEVLLSLLNGLLLAVILLLVTHFVFGYDYLIGLTVSISLIAVIIIASLIGTFVPITLNKYNIDPALATGPFITTSNDIFGIFIYFSIAKMIIGF